METHPGAVQGTLLFIPDISGFTQFVNETEIQHSQHIIEELLEAIINAHEIGLEISEIEGDAILFYRMGPGPTIAELLAQVQRMYVRFHTILRKYNQFRICQCGACCTASKLALKFIMHYGELSQKQVKSYKKLFGSGVITAHRLKGSQHRCIVNDNPKDPLVVNHEVKVEENLITLLEADLVNKFDALIQLLKVSPVITRIAYTGMIKGNQVIRLIFYLFMRKKTIREFNQTFSNLKEICEKLHRDKKSHPNRIILNMPTPTLFRRLWKQSVLHPELPFGSSPAPPLNQNRNADSEGYTQPYPNR